MEKESSKIRKKANQLKDWNELVGLVFKTHYSLILKGAAKNV